MKGYTPEQINSLMNSIADTYNRLGTTISDGWPAVSQTMQQYWVGEDEQSYEATLAKRICEMYTQSAQIVNDLNSNLENLGHQWHEFQMKNMLSNAVVTNTQIVSLDNVKVTVNEEIIKYNQVTLSNATERGVKEGALSAIRTSISDYLTNIKTSMQNMYSDIDSSRAFLGQTQAQSINTYIEQIGQSLGSVVTAANDIYSALEQLTQTAYSQSEEEVSDQFNSSNIQADIEGQLGDMKWNG